MYSVFLGGCSLENVIGITVSDSFSCLLFDGIFVTVWSPHNCLYMCRWALGVLVYFMLHGEMPFGSWRESELDTFAKIAKGQLNLSESLSPEAVDLLTKVSLKVSCYLHFSLTSLIVLGGNARIFYLVIC